MLFGSPLFEIALTSFAFMSHTHFTRRILDVWNFRPILCYNGHIIKCVNWKTLKYWTVNGNVCIHWHMKLINLHCFIVRCECNHLMVANQSEFHGHSWHSNEWSGFRFACSTYVRPYSTYAENERYPNGLFHHILCISLFLLHLHQYYCLESRLTIHKFQDKKKLRACSELRFIFHANFMGTWILCVHNIECVCVWVFFRDIIKTSLSLE